MATPIQIGQSITGTIPANASFHFEGDSITAGVGRPSWTTYALQMRNFINRGNSTNTAVPGSTLADMDARYAASVYPNRPGVGEVVYLFLLIGANDTISASSWKTAFESYVTTAKADGFTVIALTPFIRTAVTAQSGYAGAMLTSSLPDLIINTAALFRDASDTTWLSDGIHPTEFGSEVIASLVDEKLDRQAHPGARQIFESGNGVGFNTPFPHARVHSTGTFSFMMGDSVTENASKGGRLAVTPYGASTDTPPSIIGSFVDATTTRLFLGGGTSSGYASTQIEFYTAADNTTTTGTGRGRITSAGYWILGGNALATDPTISALALLDTVPLLRLSRGNGQTTDSTVINIVPSNGYGATGILADETLFAGNPSKAIAFATAATAVAPTVRMRIKETGVLNMVATPVYADNAAAASGGLLAGDEYRTSTGVKMEVY
tara:strand:- start:258 stop:1565 length:1308 start_codon:yes stop_codon:yes gene_type:complete